MALLVTVTGCSVEKNTGASRFYNSLISKYNIYFNGNESFRAGVAKVKSAHRDDYSAILPVFEYSSQESVQVCSAEMERAIQKASKVIALHSITAKPKEKKRREPRESDEEFFNRKEYNEWIDDSYLLMAKARFYQKNFSDARASLIFNLGITVDPEMVTEISIWLSRIYTEEANYSEALRVLEGINDPERSSRTIRTMIYSTYADIALRQKRYNSAIEPLTKAIEYSSDKQTRVRLTYLLAQVCKAGGDNHLSTRYFREVLRMNPSYEFEFNAGINLAGVTDINSGDAADLEKTLRRMLRDTKNKEYLDQIYFALGELARRQGRTDEAISLYSRSARNSTTNSRQKARSYLALGDYFFSLPSYMKARNYYDSAAVNIDKYFPEYETISRRASDLNEYASFHSVVMSEDSLRRVARMTESERNSLIAGIIRKLEENQQRGATDNANADRYNMGVYYENERRYEEAITNEGSWYFYNQTALAFGRTEFRRRWGDRKLEDNWRRANRSRVASAIGEMTEEGEKKDSVAVGADRKPEFYIKNLPMSDSLMTASKHKSAEALLGEGKILASRLHDTAMAVVSLESASKPEGKDVTRAEALYELYRLLKDKEPARAERRRAELLTLFPASDYSLILSDPDYVRRQNEAAMASAKAYEAAYNAFNTERFDEATRLCSDALRQYPSDELVPKFLLLEAMSAGALDGEMAYKDRLDSLVAKYPETAEGKRAAEIIEVLRREIPEIRISEDKKIAETLYVADTLQPHYVTIIAENASANLNQMVFDVINYNLDTYSEKNYRTEGSSVDNRFLVITVGTFRNMAEALQYLKTFDAGKVIRGASEAKISVMLISRDNLQKFNTDKNVARYRLFHDNTYPSAR